MSQDQAAFHAEQLAWQQEAERVLAESTRRKLTVDEARLLAWASSIKLNLPKPNSTRKVTI